MSVEIQVAINLLPALAGQIDPLREMVLDRGVAVLIATADPETPVDTGAMRANKTIERTAGARVVTWNQDYTAYVHEGTYKMPARPFTANGVTAAEAAITEALGGFGQ